MPAEDDPDQFRVLKGWDIGGAAQVRCPECEYRFFVEGEAYEGNEDAECPMCLYSEQRDFKSEDSPPLTY